MIARLGLSPAELSTREVQTANGRASARYGRLPALWLNGRRVPEVTVAFLDDARLGDYGLLGMSVLGRFRMTIDDQAGHLLLEPR
jgi:predicted aspartyl protease